MSSSPTTTDTEQFRPLPKDLLGYISRQLAIQYNELVEAFEADSSAPCIEQRERLVDVIDGFQNELAEVSARADHPADYGQLHTLADELRKQSHELYLELVAEQDLDVDGTPSPDPDPVLSHAVAVTGHANTIQRVIAQFRVQTAPTARNLPTTRAGYTFSRINKRGERDYLRLTDPNGESVIITPNRLGDLRDELYSVELSL